MIEQAIIPFSRPATAIHIANPFQPDARDIRVVEGEPTIRQWLTSQGIQEFRLPTICIINDAPVLRADWAARRMLPGDVVAFVAVPGFGAAIAAWFGLSGIWATIAEVVINIGLSIGLSAIANLLIGAPKTPSTKAIAAASPTYNVQAQGNVARLGQAIPVVYGEMRVYPDFASAPYVEYEGNEQYLYQLFCIGIGEYDILDQRIEDTPMASFPECQILGTYAPGTAVASLPAAVYTSVEVANQELEYAVAVGHFVVNPTATSIGSVAVDIVAPNGLYYANDAGDLDSRGASFSIEAAPVDAAGNPTAAFIPLGAETVSGATNTPIRKSVRYTLPSLGRWAVKITRTTPKDTSSRAGDAIQWTALRGYAVGVATYPGVTVVATKFRATNNLSDQSSRRVNFKVARKLPMWNPATRTWGAATRTRSIAWALADICRASYGAGLDDSRYDIDGIYALEQTLAARNTVYGNTGDWCDGVFDNAVTVWEALTQTARLARAMPFIQGGVIRFVRDQAQSVYTAMFTPRNIVKGTFSIDYVMPGDQTVDAVTVTYWDSEAMRPREVTAALAGSSAAKPAKLEFRGCTSHDHAWREGMYMCAANRYRRKVVSFQTELEGHIPMVGDLIIVSHDMPVWGVAGDVDGYDAVGKVFTLSEPAVFGSGSYYLMLRKRDGSPSGPWAVEPAVPADAHQVMLSAGQTLDITPFVGGDAERTHFIFGKSASADNFQLFRVLAPIKYRGAGAVELTAVNEDAYVHVADTGGAPPPPNPDLLPTRPTRPVLTRLDITQGGTPAAPVLGISWLAVAGATHYLVEISRDNEHWSRVADALTTAVLIPVEPGVVWIRVAAAGLAVGPFLSQSLTAGEVPPPGVVQGLAAAETFTGTQARIAWTATPRATRYRLEVWAAGSKRRDATVATPFFAYSAEDVLKDGGPWRALTFRVWAVSAVGESDNYASATLSNPAPGAVSGVQVYAGMRSVVVTYNRPADLDFAGLIVCMSTTSGFTPQAGVNEVYRGADRTVTIPNLVTETTYYFRVAAFDAFGTDSLDFGASEYSATIGTNLPTPTEVQDALQQALNDPAATPLIFDADLFAMRIAGTNRYPFIVGTVGGQDVIQLDANVYILGSLSASQIRTGTLAADQQIQLGGGTVILDGAGSIIVYDPNSPDPAHPDYSFFSAGRLTFQAYRGGAYHEQKSVKRIESGVANSGETVTIPGWWDAQPRIIVSPKSVQSFNQTYAAQSQAWLIEARNLRETAAGSAQWEFDAIAELNLAENSGTTTAGSSQGWSGTDTFTSLAYDLPTGTNEITATFNAGSYRGTGTGTYVWAYRAVRWKVQLYNAALSAWEDGNSYRTVAITGQGAVQAAQQDSATLSVAAGRTQVRIYAESYDAGGTYSTGADVYSYDYGAWSAEDTNTQEALAGGNFAPGGTPTPTTPVTVTANTVEPSGVSGWTIYGYQYSYEWRSHGTYGIPHHGSVSGPGLSYTTPSDDLQYDTGWAAVTHTLGYFSASASYATASANNTGSANYVSGEIRNAKARAMIQQLQTNSATPANYFQFASFAWATPAAATLAEGSLNWLAIGE